MRLNQTQFLQPHCLAQEHRLAARELALSWTPSHTSVRQRVKMAAKKVQYEKRPIVPKPPAPLLLRIDRRPRPHRPPPDETPMLVNPPAQRNLLPYLCARRRGEVNLCQVCLDGDDPSTRRRRANVDHEDSVEREERSQRRSLAFTAASTLTRSLPASAPSSACRRRS